MSMDLVVSLNQGSLTDSYFKRQNGLIRYEFGIFRLIG